MTGSDQRDPMLEKAKASLTGILEDQKVPAEVRAELAHEFGSLKEMLAKLERGEVHVTGFGRVSVGKSSLLNALAGQPVFQTGVLHGVTRDYQRAGWSVDGDERLMGVKVGEKLSLIDTPGLEEAYGKEQESIAREAARRADLILFVLDADITAPEMKALREVLEYSRPTIPSGSVALRDASRGNHPRSQSATGIPCLGWPPEFGE